MSAIEIEKVEKESGSTHIWHLIDAGLPFPDKAPCGAKLHGVDGGLTMEPDGDTCVVCADLVYGNFS